MAMIKCAECGNEITYKAPQCVQCGNPNLNLEARKNEAKKAFERERLLLQGKSEADFQARSLAALGCVAVLLLLGVGISTQNDRTTRERDEAEAAAQAKSEQVSSNISFNKTYQEVKVASNPGKAAKKVILGSNKNEVIAQFISQGFELGRMIPEEPFRLEFTSPQLSCFIDFDRNSIARFAQFRCNFDPEGYLDENQATLTKWITGGAKYPIERTTSGGIVSVLYIGKAIDFTTGEYQK